MLVQQRQSYEVNLFKIDFYVICFINASISHSYFFIFLLFFVMGGHSYKDKDACPDMCVELFITLYTIHSKCLVIKT